MVVSSFVTEVMSTGLAGASCSVAACLAVAVLRFRTAAAAFLAFAEDLLSLFVVCTATALFLFCICT